MASALTEKFKKKFKGPKRKDKAKNGASLTDAEEQGSLQSEFGEKSEKSQGNSHQSCCNSKEQPNHSKAGSLNSGDHKPKETTHKMSHSLDHPGSPDCPSLPPCPISKSLETGNDKNIPNQQMPPAQQHVLSTAEDAPSTSKALSRRNHQEHTSGALHTEHHSTDPATDGKTLNPANRKMPADGATAAGISSSPSTLQPPVVATTAASVDGSPRGDEASTVAAVAARTPAGEPQNPSNSGSSVDGVTVAGSAPLSSNQESSTAGSASADGESQNPINTEIPVVAGAAAANHTLPSNQLEQPAVTNGDSQNPERVAPENGVNSSSLQQQFNAQATTTVPPNEDESSLPSLTGPPIQVEPENVDTTTEVTSDHGTTPQEEEVNNYENFLVLEKVHGNKFLQDKLAVGLDRTCHRVIKTWEHLACTDEINAPLEVRLKCKINSENSCTLMLFDVLTSELEDKTVKDVIDALTRIKRNDAKKIITDVYPSAAVSLERFTDFSASSTNSELITKMATLLDQTSRVNQNWRHLGQQFHLSDERLKEIEYGRSAQILMEYLYTKKTNLKIGIFYDEVKKLNRKDVLKKLDPFIAEDGDRDKLMKDVIELESDAMRSICVCLNNPNRVLKNWKHLAKSSALGIPEDIYKDCEPGKSKSPTESLLEWIFAYKDDLTVGQLCSALRKIDRNDLVRDLRKHFEQNSSA